MFRKKKNDPSQNEEAENALPEQFVGNTQDTHKSHLHTFMRKKIKRCEICNSELESTRKSNLCEACESKQIQDNLKKGGKAAGVALAVGFVAKKAAPIVIKAIKKTVLK